MWWEWSLNVMVPPTLKFIRNHPEIDVTIYWNADKIEQIFASQLNIWTQAVNIRSSQNDILDSDKTNPLRLLARWKESSIVQGIAGVESWELDGFLSRWNTWAYVMAAIRALWIEGVSPALSIWMPRLDVNDRSNMPSDVLCMDVWAEMDATKEKLMSNAALWVRYLQTAKWIEFPKVWLMNIWEEAYKGDKAYREAYKLLEELYWDLFVWNVETNVLNTSLKADLIVSWWFLGNWVLKGAEWTWQTLRTAIKQWAFNNSFKIATGVHVYLMMKHRLWRFHPDNRPDWTLHGVNWKIVKVHGWASGKAVYRWLENMVSDIRAQKNTED